MSNIQARAPTEAVIPKYVQPKTILSLDVPSDLKQNATVPQAVEVWIVHAIEHVEVCLIQHVQSSNQVEVWVVQS